MNTEQAVHEARDQREATLILAAALDRIEAKLDEAPSPSGGWSSSEWDDHDKHVEAHTAFAENVRQEGDTVVAEQREVKPEPKLNVEDDGQGNVTIDIPTTSADQRKVRAAFAKETLQIGIAWNELPGEAAVNAYAEGGPLWLFYYDRDLMMSYDASVKRAMIEDIMLTHPREASDIARDILKEDSSEPSLENA